MPDLDRLNALSEIINSDAQMQKSRAEAVQQAGYSNVGNDQRQMPVTINMTITANTPLK